MRAIQIIARPAAGAAAAATLLQALEGEADQGAVSLREKFPLLIPTKPYCADNLADGLVIRSRKAALTRRHVQLNGPGPISWIVHDLDYRGAGYLAHRDAYLPPPNVIAINRVNGHAHVMTLLKVPVATHSCARPGPLAFLAAIERGLARRLDADRSYAGLITKNPLHSDWEVHWPREEPYALEELDDWLFVRDKKADNSTASTYGLGRNCMCFDAVRKFAYREVLNAKRAGASVLQFQAKLERVGAEVNLQFPQPLPFGELRSVARSVAKWTWRNFSDERLFQRQSTLGKRGAAKRWAGHVAVETSKPWEAEGISRRTWYRRKNAAAGRAADDDIDRPGPLPNKEPNT